jgi:hypothetical protein
MQSHVSGSCLAGSLHESVVEPPAAVILHSLFAVEPTIHHLGSELWQLPVPSQSVLIAVLAAPASAFTVHIPGHTGPGLVLH